MRVIILASILVIFSWPVSANPVEVEQSSASKKFVAAVISGNIEAASSLTSKDFKLFSYFDDRFVAESLDVLVANFEGLQQIGKVGEENTRAFEMCNGAATFLLKIEEANGKIVGILYGAKDFTPPPVPLRFRNNMKHCEPPVRFVGGF